MTERDLLISQLYELVITASEDECVEILNLLAEMGY